MKRPVHPVAEIQDKDAEIERLNAVITLMNDASKVLLKEKDAQIKRLQSELEADA